jgi:hypothetical protein
MNEESGQAELGRVVEDWAHVLAAISVLVGQVWRANRGRYEPVRMGDDATTLGILSSRNLSNLAVSALTGVPGVTAVNRNTLEVTYAGRVLHAGKAPSESPTWDVHSISWTGSDVRTDGAAANSAVYAAANSSAYSSAAGTLFEDTEILQTRAGSPRDLRYLHLLWQGFTDATVRTWLGFPGSGTDPWHAVTLLAEPGDGSSRRSPLTTGPVPSGSDYDELSEPPVAVTRRPAAEPRQLPGA